MPDQTSKIRVRIYDGTRQPLNNVKNQLIRMRDGMQKEVFAKFIGGPDITVTDLPFYNNFGDQYAALVSGDNYDQAGFYPVNASPALTQIVDLMLLPKKRHFNFAGADWQGISGSDPRLVAILTAGAASEAAEENRYEDLRENHSSSLAAFFNICTAMKDIHLQDGGPLDYIKQLVWDDPLAPAQDRFFAWVDARLVQQVTQACTQGKFAQEFDSGLFHSGATSSYKEIQFGEANVQITFHENEKKNLNGVDCIIVEPDIDYYRDLGAHALLEALGNMLSGQKTNPEIVYVLRWMAGRCSGLPDFNPPYTILADV